MFIRPVDLPALKAETIDAVARYGPIVFEKAIHDKRQGCYPRHMPAPEAARVLTEMEVARLCAADLFHVSAPMVALARTAERSLPEFSLLPEDLPTAAGFVFFEQPIETFRHDDRQGEISLVAASWGPFQTQGVVGLWVTWYSDVAHLTESAVRFGEMAEQGQERARAMIGRLCIENENQTPFTDYPIPITDTLTGEEFPYAGRSDESTAQWLGVLKTIWLLMGQSLASVQDAHLDRAARRRLAREYKEPPRVRVITLRRPKGSGEGESDREYHHRWIVRGHWRQQWYPSRAVNRPVWIAPHIKGPEDAPLLGGEKVYALRR